MSLTKVRAKAMAKAKAEAKAEAEAQIKKANLVGPDVIAERLGVDEQTVKRWAQEGRIPSFPLTRNCKRFDLAEVLKSIGR